MPDRDTIRSAAKLHEPDRYVAALLAPPAARQDLVALAAYTGEILRIGESVRDAHLAEIRLQWWRDALFAQSQTRTGNPVADAFGELSGRYGFSREALETWFDAVVHTYYADAPPNEEALLLELDLLEGTPFRLASRIIGGNCKLANDHQDLIRNAAQAYGLARRGLKFPHALARGRTPIPETESHDWSAARAYLCRLARERLAQAKPACETAPEPVKQALLPLALVEPYLRVLEKRDHDISRDIGDIAPITRAWKLWRLSRTARL